ncbi:MAG: hypothetical protein R3174_15255, partial [Gammaproteobacteria bacterium]|nr:hypothetical protein [Gammaproteobacteria bacterium]
FLLTSGGGPRYPPMHVEPNMTLVRVWRQTLSVATAFWAVCLVLVALEATMGANFIVGGLFFLSIPMLVAFIIWATKDLMLVLRRDLSSVLVLGVCVFFSSTVIILIGLLAAANLKSLMLGA